MFLVVFFNRPFPEKAVRIWCESSEEERILIVEDFFPATPELGESQLWASLGKPRPWDEAEVERRKRNVGRTLRCPYCGSRLKKWAVPQTPFTEWHTEFFRICFDDRCPFLVRGWDAMHAQGNRGFSHRFLYDPDRDHCGSIPVPSLQALRESIVEEEGEEQGEEQEEE